MIPQPKLVVGTNLHYVKKVANATNWVGLTPVNLPLAEHRVYGWKKDAAAVGLFVSHRTNNKDWNTYVPDVDDLTQITEGMLDSLTRLYERVSANPAAVSGDLIRFMIPPDVERILSQPNPNQKELRMVQTAQSILGINLAFVEREVKRWRLEVEQWDLKDQKKKLEEELQEKFLEDLSADKRKIKGK